MTHGSPRPTEPRARRTRLMGRRPLALIGGAGILAAAVLLGMGTSPDQDAGSPRPADHPATLAEAPSPSAEATLTEDAAMAALFAPSIAASSVANSSPVVPAAQHSRERLDPTPISGLAASGIPSTALAAYRQAAVREDARTPQCHLSWPLLGGIGRVESNHGRFAGAVLHADGVSTPHIIGIPLDGHGTALIRDTDDGRVDGDTVYDRAVGPMQFIPSTWSTWGVDANSDGTRDPFNLFDAAAAAADYLCAAGRDLSTGPGQVRAILSYNHSSDYVAAVMGVEKIYAQQTGVTVPILPTDPSPGQPEDPTLPPVDPGPPGGAPPPSKPKPAPSPSSTKPQPKPSGLPSSPSPSCSSASPSPSPTTPAPSPSPSLGCVAPHHASTGPSSPPASVPRPSTQSVDDHR